MDVRLGALIAALCLLTMPSSAQERSIIIASTTSTEQSGLFAQILPRFTAKTGIHVRVVALGTGQALEFGRRGDADVVFVHDREAEEKFVAEGFAEKRLEVVYNDFIVIGPKSDLARAKGRDVSEAFKKIAAKRAPFISRGDRSGTHAAELRFWRDVGVDVTREKGEWYKEIGQGMGSAFNTASATNAYVLSDRGTWLSFKNRQDLSILVEGDHRLFNQYGVMLVNPSKHPHIKAVEGRAFIDWLVSSEGQKSIADYTTNGEQLFFPNANKSGLEFQTETLPAGPVAIPVANS